MSVIHMRLPIQPDPRDPPVNSPSLIEVAEDFKRRLAASEDIAVLAHMLAVCHGKLEGWLGWPVPSKTLPPGYAKAAEMAVRFLSEPIKARAEQTYYDAAEQHFAELEYDLRSCDVDAGERRRLIRVFMLDCLQQYHSVLRNG